VYVDNSTVNNVRNADYIFSSINILKISSNTREFKEWLKEYHGITNDSELYQGYRFFIITSLKLVLNSFSLSSGFNIKRDFVYNRAEFVGVPIEDIPNSCERIVLMKNIWNLHEEVQDSKNWNDIITAIGKLDQLFSTFDRLYEYSVLTDDNFEKDYVLNIQTMLSVLVFLNDTKRGIPQASIFPVIIVPKIKEEYFSNAFKGYVYTLQYLWYKLLGDNKFKNECVRDLHKTIIGKQKKSVLSIFNHEEDLTDEEKEWKKLDLYFGKINEEIVKPLKGVLDNHLTMPENCINISNKSLFKPFLNNTVKNPVYLTKYDPASMKKRLNLLLLWYTVNVLDKDVSHLFNGVPTFIQTMIGSIELNKYYNVDDNILVRIFKHPVGKDEYDYSFGLFINGQNSWYADYSGWLIFYNCATDYSGFGGSNLEYAKKFLREYQEHIELREITISKKIFKEYIIEKSIANEGNDFHIEKDENEEDQDNITKSIDDKTSKLIESLDKQDFNQFMGNVKGKFFEYVFFKLKHDDKIYEKLECDSKKYGQIDCVGYLKDRIDVYECKYAIHSDKLDDDIDQLLKKRDEFTKEKGLKVIPYIVTYKKMNKNIKEQLTEKDIKVIDDFRTVIENSNEILLKNSITDIMHILDYKI
jgi:hypothetical protein